MWKMSLRIPYLHIRQSNYLYTKRIYEQMSQFHRSNFVWLTKCLSKQNHMKVIIYFRLAVDCIYNKRFFLIHIREKRKAGDMSCATRVKYLCLLTNERGRLIFFFKAAKISESENIIQKYMKSRKIMKYMYDIRTVTVFNV